MKKILEGVAMMVTLTIVLMIAISIVPAFISGLLNPMEWFPVVRALVLLIALVIATILTAQYYEK